MRRRALELMKVPSKAATRAIRSIKARIEGDRRFQKLKKVLLSLLFLNPAYHHRECITLVMAVLISVTSTVKNAALKAGFPP